MIDQAFIMAAGMGKRMQPLSLDRPKPMVEVMGRPIIDHILDHLRRVGVFHVVINLYHCGDVLRNHLHDVGDMQIVFSEEDTLLDTGGGLQQGLRYMSDPTKPFYAINGDAFWQEQETLPQLHAAWNDQAMDVLLL